VIDLNLEKYRVANQEGEKSNILQENNVKEQLWIDNIIEEIDNKRGIAISSNKNLY